MVATIRFSVTPDKKKIQVQIASIGGELRYYGVPVIPINLPQPLEVENTAVTSMVVTLQNLQAVLSSRLLVYYGGSPTAYSGYETIDGVIKSLMDDIGKNTIGQGASIEELKQRLASRKAYARYYYEMFKGNNKTLDSLDNAQEAEVKIVAQVVCYYFIKRLVHIFVMSAIYERVLADMGASTSAPTTYVPMASSTSANTPSPDANAAMRDLKLERERFEQQKKDLMAMMGNQNIGGDQKIKQLMDQLNAITAQMQEKDTKITDLTSQVDYMSKRVANYRDLLLQSHDLLFKIDEIPNMMTQ